MRNPLFKGCIYNKDISYIHHHPGELQDHCCIFEGFMDFLSYLTIQKRNNDYRMVIDEPCDYIILNSVSNLRKCLVALEKYYDIHCFLDNDIAGQNAVATIKKVYAQNTVDESFRYADSKDLNDYLLGRKM